MCNLRQMLLSLLLVLVFSPNLVAQTIKFDDKQPSSPAAGRVNGTGEFSLKAEHEFTAIFLVAMNPKGGPGGEVNCQVNQMTKTWNGLISGLPAATYKVYARLYYKDGGGKKQILDTPLGDLAVN